MQTETPTNKKNKHRHRETRTEVGVDGLQDPIGGRGPVLVGLVVDVLNLVVRRLLASGAAGSTIQYQNLLSSTKSKQVNRRKLRETKQKTNQSLRASLRDLLLVSRQPYVDAGAHRGSCDLAAGHRGGLSARPLDDVGGVSAVEHAADLFVVVLILHLLICAI